MCNGNVLNEKVIGRHTKFYSNDEDYFRASAIHFHLILFWLLFYYYFSHTIYRFRYLISIDVGEKPLMRNMHAWNMHASYDFVE